MGVVEDLKAANEKWMKVKASKSQRGYAKAKAEVGAARAAWRAAGRPDTPNGPDDAAPAPPTTKSKPRMKGN